MLNALREFEIGNKSFTCQLYDVILKPVNIVLGMRKVVFIQVGQWEKQERSHTLAVVVLSYIATVVLGPIVLTALLLKSRNREFKECTMQYKIDAKENKLNKQHFAIESLVRHNDTFTFTISDLKTNIHTKLTYTWFGKMKEWSNLLTSSAPTAL